MVAELNKDHAGKDEECCPRFDPAQWDEKIMEWKEKKFVRGKVRTLFFIPLGFGRMMRKLDQKIHDAGASIQDNMGLSDHTSRWNMDVYIAVDRMVPKADNTNLSGNFLSKVYEGDFKETGKWWKDYHSYAEGKNLKVEKCYMWYTTCPKCAKKYGKNYVALVGKIS